MNRLTIRLSVVVCGCWLSWLPAGLASAPPTEAEISQANTPTQLEMINETEPAAAPADPATTDTATSASPIIRPGSKPKSSATPAEGGVDLNRGWLALAGVLGIIGLVTWALRRWGPAARLGGESAIKIIGRTYLAPKQSLTLVRLGRRVLLLGATSEQITCLSHIENDDEVAELLAANKSIKKAPRQEFDGLLVKEFAQYEEPAAEPQVTDAGQAVDYLATREDLRELVRKVQAMNHEKKVG
ncbi:MAG: hypothetical protein HJJLKODD_01838 [Phycisphaerae bacterium]|nr:hypothetical protein [Phycisphaerae bacterium]